MKKIYVSDMTLAAESVKKSGLSFKEKIEVARQLDKLSVDVIEFALPENLKTDTLLVRTVSSFVKNSIISVPVGLTEESVDTTWNCLCKAEKPRLKVSVPVSSVQMEYLCHMKAPKMLDAVAKLVKKCVSICEDVEFCAVDATRAEEDFLVSLVNAAIEAGAKTVTFIDEEGTAMPDDFGSFILRLKEKIPALENVRLGVGCKDGLKLSLASGISALKAGADEIKVCTSGGEYAHLKDFATIIKDRGEDLGYRTSLLYTELERITSQIEWATNTTRSATSPFDSGVDDKKSFDSELNAKDDITTVIAAIKKLGYDLSEEDNNKVYEAFKHLAEKKQVSAKELEALIASTALQVPATYKLISYVINSGNVITASAHIVLEKDGKTVQGIALGDGPIDAAFLSVERIIGHHYELDDFQIQSVTEGREAVGSALVKLRSNGKLYSGNGISTDIIGASIRAYINALNKIVYEEN